MVDHNRRRRSRAFRTARALLAISLVCGAAAAAHAQGMMRSPNINIGARLPTIAPSAVPRPPSISAHSAIRTPSIQPVLPSARYSPNLSPTCPAAQRAADGECLNDAISSDDGGAGGNGRKGKKGAGGGRNTAVQAAINASTIARELVAEIDGTLSDAQADALAQRHRLVRVSSQSFPLIDATIGLFRITDQRPVDRVSRELAADANVRSVQPNFRYVLQETAPSEGDPAQYAL